MRGQHPFVKRNLGALKDRIDGHGVLRTAVAAEVQARAVRSAFEFGLTVGAATMGAHCAIGPAQRFKMLACCAIVVESGFGEEC